MKKIIDRNIKFHICKSSPKKVMIERVKDKHNRKTENLVIIRCYSISEIESMKGHKY